MTHLVAIGLSIGFVIVSAAFRMLLWGSLSFLDEKSVLRNTVAGALALLAIIALTVLTHRRLPMLEHPDLKLIPNADLKSVRLTVLGFLAGSVLFGIVFILVSVTGGIRVEWRPVGLLSLVGSLLGALSTTILYAAWEEYTFRGWAFSACAKTLGPHTTAIGLGTTFGLAHLFNPNWTVAAIASVAFAGFLLSYSMLAGGNILVPIGLHIGWNFTQSLLTSARFWVVSKHPNPLVSGGDWGLEGSATGIAATAVGAGLMFLWFVSRRRRGILSPDIRSSGESALQNMDP